MSNFLRIGVSCAAFDEQGCVLLSQRGDLRVWNLPSGRLDSGERLEDAAAREAREETGLEVEIERLVGLYFVKGWSRLNVLYKARVVGGTLLQRTHETLANQFFALEAIPENTVPWHKDYVPNALDGQMHMTVIQRPAEELRRVKRQLAWRWMKNLISGRPEPRFPRFAVSAMLVINDNERHGEIVLGNSGQSGIAEIECHGDAPPWAQLRDYMLRHKIYKNADAHLNWAGLSQDVESDRITFKFSL